ncbi:MAG: hypothetical protein A2X59_02925 [Nitrospirae bacterium GWC2_42_7]|nr:MAG: hypothetical protein A2X59_02925 [Nitrospirae bacterium GWC2_42_7]
MDIVLNETEIRIIGALIEKELTTPEYYPLSLNALTNACNQKSNRNPVVSYDESSVENGLKSLAEKGLVKEMHAGSRVTKYIHSLLDLYDLSGQETAILCEMMLRGPQTAGELRSRADRMAKIENLEEAEKTLQSLMEHEPPLVIKLPRQTGRKESRYMHLLSDMPLERSAVEAPAEISNETILRLEEEMTKLRAELDELKQAFEKFSAQF